MEDNSNFRRCDASSTKDATLYNASKIRYSVAAIVAKRRSWFNLVQRLQQQKCCETWWLLTMLHEAISHATCHVTKLRDKLLDKLHGVKTRSHDQVFLDKFHLLVCTKKIDNFSLTSCLFQKQFLWKVPCQRKIVKENLVVCTGLNIALTT